MKAEEQFEVESPAFPESEPAESETTDATESIDMPDYIAPAEKMFIKNLTDFGVYQEF
jgi:hypothetical protein